MNRNETLSERAARVGTAQGLFDRIRVDYPPQTEVMAALDEMRIAALARRPGTPSGGAMLVAPHGSGKSEAIVALDKLLGATAQVGQKRLLHIEISTTGTTDSIPTSILAGLGAARPDAGSEKVRWPRAIAEMKRSGVELVVVDEFNRASRRPTMSRPIATAIRERIMDAGIAPVAFVGSEDAGKVLEQVPELMERLQDNIDLSPMRWDSAGDRNLFLAFVADLDREMVAASIVDCQTGFADAPIAWPLWMAASGRVRRISNIVRLAMTLALRDGRTAIYRDDLAEAVAIYCIPRGFCGSNPFDQEAQ